MREAHPLSKRVAETLDLGSDDDLFDSQNQQPAPRPAKRQKKNGEEPSFGDALRGLLGSLTAGGNTG